MLTYAGPVPGRSGAAERPAGSPGTQKQKFRLEALVAKDVPAEYQGRPNTISRKKMFSDENQRDYYTANSSERRSDGACDSRSSHQVPSLFHFKPRQHIFEQSKGQEHKVKSPSASHDNVHAISVQSENQEQRNH